MAENILKFFKTPGLSPVASEGIQLKLQEAIPRLELVGFRTETCFYVGLDGEESLRSEEIRKLRWVLSEPFEDGLCNESTLGDTAQEGDSSILIEIGPRLNFSTAWSTNAVSICRSIGLSSVSRLECSMRYQISTKPRGNDLQHITKKEEEILVSKLHDRMTECRYVKPLTSFAIDVKPEDCYEVQVMAEGRKALEKVNKDLGLAFDDWDLDYYTMLFRDRVGRNPTSVECFDLAQSNSEHSRHWFFKGKMVIDGEEKEDTLFKMVMKTQQHTNQNNVIKFSDNSSAIEGFEVPVLSPEDTDKASRYQVVPSLRHIIFTAETHNFPTGVAPFSGATTGTGGRIRDVQSTGQGAHVVAGTAGYSFGNLHIPGYPLPWEDSSFDYPDNFAHPLDIIIEASNGASDYGNKFGEPVLTGFARSFGVKVGVGERREWVKPIMFSGGIGMMDGKHVTKSSPEKGMDVVKIGGPVFRIGVGGGAASSIQVQGDNESELDFGAVQRGDAEMEQKLNRALRACIERGEKNPICSIHDQGAGGNGNVLKEISEPAGAVIHVKEFSLGDLTLSVMEIWGAEYQESNALLVKPQDADLLRRICQREKVPVDFVGKISGDGKIVLEHEVVADVKHELNGETPTKRKKTHPVDLELDVVLGKMPQKVFDMKHEDRVLQPLVLEKSVTVKEALDRVLRLPSVCSKRYLTNKVDRSVTGLVAQQQCVGPLHTPVADVAVTALSQFTTVGLATAIGEQPIKGLVDPACGARMSVGEALTNLVFARISDLKDVKCSGNWMYAAKLPGEGAALYDACVAMSDVMSQLGIAVDGGKDSLSMAARVGSETVKAPGTLVVSVYAPCPDVTATVTPDLKTGTEEGVLLYVTPNPAKARLGGSALAQVYKQIGNTSPDMDSPKVFEQLFLTTQQLLAQGLILSGHDVSDGGLVTTLLEMSFAGNCGIKVDIPTKDEIETELQGPLSKVLSVLFAEELGLVLEVQRSNVPKVLEAYRASGVPCFEIGHGCGQGVDARVTVSVNSEMVIDECMVDLRDTWEATSFQLERLQANPKCVSEDEGQLRLRQTPKFNLTFGPQPTKEQILNDKEKPKVAIIREEGSNGDREMAASFQMAGFEVWDVNMYDLGTGQVSLESFRGIVFVGGFSYADVLGSAKGWAATALFNPTVRSQLVAFCAREDTFSLGVCNGCQLMAQLGWVCPLPGGEKHQSGVSLARNTSERFESRFVSVRVNKSPALMLKGMEGSVMGVWVAHGEGKFNFKDEDIRKSVRDGNRVPFQFTDEEGRPTTQYPLNPNGSPEGIAGICSSDGRHLAMMPHPERCTQLWQWAWMPTEWKKSLAASPWLKMFQNAYDWCVNTKS